MNGCVGVGCEVFVFGEGLGDVVDVCGVYVFVVFGSVMWSVGFVNVMCG